MGANHILLRAPKGAGKTTILRMLADETGLPVYGFVTKKEAPGADGLSATYLHPASAPRADWTFSAENRVGTSSETGITEARPEVFDTLGVRLLSEAEKGGILIMDELGVMEQDAEAFRAMVMEALDGDIRVLAAVKQKDHPFLEQVSRHPNARLIEFTEETREEALEKARALLGRK